MIHVANIIHSLTLGGAARTMIATAKYTRALGEVRHSLCMLDLKHSDPQAIEFALNEGMEIPAVTNREQLFNFLQSADIVQVNWWQHPDMDDFFRSNLPPMRLLGWFHCASDRAPQLLTDELVSICDLTLGGSSYTYFAPAIWRLSPEERLRKTDYVVGGADFSRLPDLSPIPHEGYRIGYIGTVNPVKMYRRFVPLHLGLDIPEAKVVVCGGDRHLILQEEAESLGLSYLFDFKGYVEDINPILRQLDVYGYPLCDDTYAASELNLQEAMYAGLPAVVFPHGGLKTLVVNEFNGLVVHSEIEYREALRYLYHHPEERKRMGQNAALFARQMFGAENHAPKMLRMYERLMQQEKRERRWPGYTAQDSSTIVSSVGQPSTPVIGSRRFIESLGDQGAHFEASYKGASLEAILKAEAQIMESSELMTFGGIFPYKGCFPSDPHLALWVGIALLGLGKGCEGAPHLLEAYTLGLPSDQWRVFWYLLLISKRFSDEELNRMALKNLEALQPDMAAIICAKQPETNEALIECLIKR